MAFCCFAKLARPRTSPPRVLARCQSRNSGRRLHQSDAPARANVGPDDRCRRRSQRVRRQWKPDATIRGHRSWLGASRIHNPRRCSPRSVTRVTCALPAIATILADPASLDFALAVADLRNLVLCSTALNIEDFCSWILPATHPRNDEACCNRG
jgi:hypothetical protein